MRNLMRSRKHAMEAKKVYWAGKIGETDDFGNPYGNVMYDAKTFRGRWANMSEHSFNVFGVPGLGIGNGQKYEKQADGRWLKVEG
jgi:hypothetical protein